MNKPPRRNNVPILVTNAGQSFRTVEQVIFDGIDWLVEHLYPILLQRHDNLVFNLPLLVQLFYHGSINNRTVIPFPESLMLLGISQYRHNILCLIQNRSSRNKNPVNRNHSEIFLSPRFREACLKRLNVLPRQFLILND